MDVLNPAVDVDRFFQCLATSDERALFLDFDGTLAPFQDDRHQVAPFDGVRQRLNAMLAEGHTRVVVVTGRVAQEMPDMLGLDVVPEIWGTHGWERRRPDGVVEGPDLDATTEQALADTVEQARSLELGDRLERKPATVAVHTRGLSDGEARRLVASLKKIWQPLADRSDAELHAFDGGLEMRVPGRNKGTAVMTVLAEMDQPVAAYLGDDLTDEEAFRALDGHGLRVLVRPTFRETDADVWIRPPNDLLAWLDRWHEASKEVR